MSTNIDAEKGLARPADTVPRAHAQIYWNRVGSPQRICDVRVVDRREVLAGQFDDGFDCCGGAAYCDWGTPAKAVPGVIMCSALTPAGQFGAFLAQGFASAEDACRAVYEFARIEGESWAQRMLMGFTDEQEDAALRLPMRVWHRIHLSKGAA